MQSDASAAHAVPEVRSHPRHLRGRHAARARHDRALWLLPRQQGRRGAPPQGEGNRRSAADRALHPPDRVAGRLGLPPDLPAAGPGDRAAPAGLPLAPEAGPIRLRGQLPGWDGAGAAPGVAAGRGRAIEPEGLLDRPEVPPGHAGPDLLRPRVLPETIRTVHDAGVEVAGPEPRGQRSGAEPEARLGRRLPDRCRAEGICLCRRFRRHPHRPPGHQSGAPEDRPLAPAAGADGPRGPARARG